MRRIGEKEHDHMGRKKIDLVAENAVSYFLPSPVVLQIKVQALVG